MSAGDYLIGKKTFYKEIEMKSRFETKIAYFLDCLNIKWIYEPRTFMLTNGIIYCPDFFLPELNMWIEAKGVIEEHNKEISRCFVKDVHTELLMIGSNPSETFWVSSTDPAGFEDTRVYLGKCSHCNSYFFCSNLGWYNCRKYKAHEGDHDLINELTEIITDFSDIKSIKEGLKGYDRS
jgi:hypothetical protein